MLGRFTWQVTAAGTADQYRALLEDTPPGAAPPDDRGIAVLTVDYGRLGVRPGDRLLDLGCGFGRHAYEAARLGAEVVALDAGADEVRSVQDTLGAMVDGRRARRRRRPGSARCRATRSPCPSPTASFDRVIASEVLEHIPDDAAAMAELARVLRPGGTMAVTVPRCGPEFVNWALSDEYHDVPGGHVRIYRHSELVERLRTAGLVADRQPPRPRTALAVLVAAVPGRARPTTRHPAVAAYHRLLVWDIEKAPKVTRYAERVLNPLIGKSLVVYLVKPVATSPDRVPTGPVGGSCVGAGQGRQP